VVVLDFVAVSRNSEVLVNPNHWQRKQTPAIGDAHFHVQWQDASSRAPEQDRGELKSTYTFSDGLLSDGMRWAIVR